MKVSRKLERLKKAQRSKALDCEQMVAQIHEYAEAHYGEEGRVYHENSLGWVLTHLYAAEITAPTLAELLNYVRDIATRERV